MNPAWKDWLLAHGAALADDAAVDFGDALAEKRAALAGPVLCDLSHLALLAVEGEDAQAFLHGQLTGDVAGLAAGRSVHTGWCTAKGRLFASMLLWRSGPAGYRLQLPRDNVAAVHKRLSMFVLRSRVSLRDLSEDTVRLGLAGPGAAALLEGRLGPLPGEDFAVAVHGAATLLRMPGERFQILLPAADAPALAEALAAGARLAGSRCWRWLEIRAGIPTVLEATREEFVPQMANLEILGGVSFTKGCYPGQEIIARTQYLGRLKRRMYRVHLDGEQPARPGDHLYGADGDGQATGTLVDAEASPDGGQEGLAVLQIASVDAGTVRWGSPDGPAVTVLPLPYPV